ncbi:Thiol-disulfide oxidoreductase ResA [Rubripirellula tenax]|uniref:Thiol-disulfide oxidoreductase ResA n=1 Tax=Rubripirellula tenax TaxID=2528015 RepID=A0A5C6F9C6_9BACT|nr:Thiol-disulfide oxidoreductase ResA [Rubripirellula tenax]
MAIAFLGTIFVTRLNRSTNSSATDHVAVGKELPQLDLVALDSGKAMNADEIAPEGTVRLLHFWGTWCPPCRMEYPHLAETATQLSANSNFRFVPVSCESGGGETMGGLAQKTREYFASENINSPALADPRGLTRQSAVDRLEQPSLYYPTSMLISPAGKIVGVWEGYTPDAVDEIAAAATQLLTGLQSREVTSPE